jgi:hypothetical protein
MKSVALVLAFLAALVLAIPVMVLLRDAFGSGVVLIVSAVVGGMAAAWLGHTPASQAVADDFCGALRDAGMSQKEAAFLMGVGEAVLANQIAGREMLSAYRLANLGPAFTAAYAQRQLARAGSYTVVKESTLARVLQALVGEPRRVA